MYFLKMNYCTASKQGNAKKKELLKILKQANKTKITGGGKDGDRTQNSEAWIFYEKMRQMRKDQVGASFILLKE